MIPAIDILEDVALAPRTTLELGGPARYYVRAREERLVGDAILWAKRRGAPVVILGGGSNLVVADEGFDELVIEMAMTGIEERDEGDRVLVTAAAGEDWDLFVERCVHRGLAGLECLGGIPGRVGATPIQNVGAYGQEVAETILEVRALDRDSGQIVTRTKAQCAFAYRDSAFKRDPNRFVVLDVTFALTPEGPPAMRYAELTRRLADEPSPSLARVREVVIALRRSKSMVLDPGDPNRRCAGSFFTNPIVDPATADAVVTRAIAAGVVDDAEKVPRWPQPEGRVKLAAGWLVERSGMAKGTRRGQVGISTAHALALVHHGDGTTAELMQLAAEVVSSVEDRFGVTLEMEPRRWP